MQLPRFVRHAVPSAIAMALTAATLVASAPVASAAGHQAACGPPPRADVSYALGGATTGSGSFVDTFQPQLAAAIRAAGLELGGLERQIGLAEQTLFDVDAAADLFWVWAGANDYITGERDPTLPPARLGAALERLYTTVGARVFVVPGLPPLGYFPAVSTSGPTATSGMNGLVAYHNQVLAGVLARFEATHADAHVIRVDMAAAFVPLLSDPRFTNVTQSCVDVAIPRGESCAGFLFVDGLHPDRLAAAAFADAAAAAIHAARPGAPVRRVISFGDSFSDTGAFFDLTTRAVGTGNPPAPLYFQGRFSDGPNVIDDLEALLDVEVASAFFATPRTAGVSALPRHHGHGQLRGTLELDATVLVPDLLPGEGVSGRVSLELGDVTCRYRAGEGGFRLAGCSHGADAGSRVRVHRVVATVDGSALTSWRAELLYY